MKTFSLAEFAAHLLTVKEDMKLAEDIIVVRGCKMIRRKARSYMGHEQDWWPPLKEETIERKAKGNTPLLETGDLKRSIEITAPVHEGGVTVGYVGSNSMVAVYQELGTTRIPPRSFLGAASMQCEHKIHEMAAETTVATLVNGGRNYREVLHALRELGHAAKELWDEFVPEDEDENKRK